MQYNYLTELDGNYANGCKTCIIAVARICRFYFISFAKYAFVIGEVPHTTNNFYSFGLFIIKYQRIKRMG